MNFFGLKMTSPLFRHFLQNLGPKYTVQNTKSLQWHFMDRKKTSPFQTLKKLNWELSLEQSYFELLYLCWWVKIQKKWVVHNLTLVILWHIMAKRSPCGANNHAQLLWPFIEWQGTNSIRNSCNIYKLQQELLES